MFLFLKSVFSKLYRIWISSIEIILENENENNSSVQKRTIQNSISSQKLFVYPETIITDLSRKIEHNTQ